MSKMKPSVDASSVNPLDHRELNRHLEVYALDPEIGVGLPLWLPNGAAIREELEKFVKELEFQAGYHRVSSPQIAKESLYRKSGHIPYYSEAMYPAIEIDDGEEDASEEKESRREPYRLRPMNCPHHHRIFAAKPRSYRDLPLRLAEYGQAYRYEPSGSLSGIIRARGFCQNDAHLYCRREQVAEEIAKILAMHEEAYRVLGLKGFRYRLSLWDPSDEKRAGKYVQKPEEWEWAQDVLRKSLEGNDVLSYEAPGEAAFYGPKIDVQMIGVSGKEESISSIQIDVASAEKLGLFYIDEKGEKVSPIILHRAPLGSHERFIAFLMEYFQGAFPFWLSPLQVRILPIADRHVSYAREVEEKLRRAFVRADVDERAESLPKKIREASLKKIPLVVVVGDREIESGELSVRKRGERDLKLKIEEFLERLGEAQRMRKNQI